MPERTIQKVQTYGDTHGKLNGRHYVTISFETWKTFELNKLRTEIQCEINFLLKSKKKIVFAGSETGI